MWSGLSGPVSPGTAWARRARCALTLACLALAWSGLAGAASVERDPALKAQLREALTRAESFPDRFDAQVWLTDMASRLGNRVPDPEERLEILISAHRHATASQLPPEMVLAVIDVESNFQRYAVSTANAQGLMQIMRFWLDELDMPGDALFEIDKNIRMGCTILRYYLELENGDWSRALARYNGSLGSTRYPNLVFERLRTTWFRN